MAQRSEKPPLYPLRQAYIEGSYELPVMRPSLAGLILADELQSVQEYESAGYEIAAITQYVEGLDGPGPHKELHEGVRESLEKQHPKNVVSFVGPPDLLDEFGSAYGRAVTVFMVRIPETRINQLPAA